LVFFALFFVDFLVVFLVFLAAIEMAPPWEASWSYVRDPLRDARIGASD
jgi:hypothetical protein